MMDGDAIARENIRDLVARYNIAGDQHLLEPFMATFSDDAVFESIGFRCEGKAEIRTRMEAAWGKEGGAGPRFRCHHLTTTQIDLIAPDAAKGRIYYFVATDLGFDHCGYYHDHYRQIAGRWHIARRGVWMDWSHPDSLFVPEIAKRAVAEHGSAGPDTVV